MPKVSIYLPVELYAAARAEGLAVSAIAQDALATALRREQNTKWIARQSRRPTAARGVETSVLMDAVRDDFG